MHCTWVVEELREGGLVEVARFSDGLDALEHLRHHPERLLRLAVPLRPRAQAETVASATIPGR